MQRPNPEQINVAIAILKQFIQQDGTTASDTRLNMCVHSIAAALGAPGQPAAEFNDCIKGVEVNAEAGSNVTVEEDGTFVIEADNGLGIPKGTYTLVEYEEEEDDPTDDPAATDPDPLPTKAALDKMNKSDLLTQAKAEGVAFSENAEFTNPEIVEAILGARTSAN